MTANTLVSAADLEYLTSRGFKWDPLLNQFSRQVGDQYQHLSPNWSPGQTGLVAYWNAVVGGDVTGNPLVVHHDERTESPITCFVMAETRGWRGL